jgi:hypothetical protein
MENPLGEIGGKMRFFLLYDKRRVVGTGKERNFIHFCVCVWCDESEN